MFATFVALPSYTQALLAGLFTFGLTALGGVPVFFSREMSRNFLDSCLGAAAGIMIAASFWSLLEPAIEMAESMGMTPWLPVLTGFLAGGFFLLALDRVLPHLHRGKDISEAEGVHTTWQRTTLLILTITLHNIPEGLAVGVAFGAAASGMGDAELGRALALTLGIGLQNFPEGAAIALPLRREGWSAVKSCSYAALSGVVEPIAAVVGAMLVGMTQLMLPFALAFAAGAMIFVVTEELIPEAEQNGSDLPTVGLLIGFAIMMVLDVALG